MARIMGLYESETYKEQTVVAEIAVWTTACENRPIREMRGKIERHEVRWKQQGGIGYRGECTQR